MNTQLHDNTLTVVKQKKTCLDLFQENVKTPPCSCSLRGYLCTVIKLYIKYKKYEFRIYQIYRMQREISTYETFTTFCPFVKNIEIVITLEGRNQLRF